MSFSDQAFEELFSDLIDAKLPMFRAISTRIVNSPADADDAIQSALIKAWNKRATFRNPEAISGWVTRIVIRESYEVLRKRMRENRKIQEYEMPEEDGRVALLEELKCGIAELPELYRETLEVAILDELESAEAARQLGCSVNTLYQRIHKAKRLLRAIVRRLEA